MLQSTVFAFNYITTINEREEKDVQGRAGQVAPSCTAWLVTNAEKPAGLAQIHIGEVPASNSKVLESVTE
jgi:hypothetical protein